MLLRPSAARLLIQSAGSLKVSRPSFSACRAFASHASLAQAASSSNGLVQATQEPNRGTADAPQEEQVAEESVKPRPNRSNPHYVNPLKPRVSIRTRNGRELTFNLDPTPKANVEKLREAVKTLCSWPADYNQDSKVYTVGQPQWSLTKNGDGVFRLLAVKSSKEGNSIASRIQKVAEEMNHHPTIISMKPEGPRTPYHMCVINTTHRPRGLSMRDIRLAQAIDTILLDYDVERPIFNNKHEQAVTILRRTNNRIRIRIFKAIQDAVAKAAATPDTSKIDANHTETGAG